MAQELREGDGKSGIARAGKRKWGYDPAQVDAFLERAHMLYESEGVQLTQHDIQNVLITNFQPKILIFSVPLLSAQAFLHCPLSQYDSDNRR